MQRQVRRCTPYETITRASTEAQRHAERFQIELLTVQHRRRISP